MTAKTPFPQVGGEHTPGPWQINPRYPTFVSSADGSSDIVEVDGWPLEYMAEETANRRLIAAAPELLEALKDILDSVGDVSMDGYVDNSLHSDEVEKARAAIKKATQP